MFITICNSLGLGPRLLILTGGLDRCGCLHFLVAINLAFYNSFAHEKLTEETPILSGGDITGIDNSNF